MQQYIDSKLIVIHADEPQLLILIWLAMLLVVIVYFVRTRIISANRIKKVVQEASTAQQPEDHEAVLLLTTNYEILGANETFYHLTGLKRTNPELSTIEEIASIFPEPTRQSSLQRLLQQLKLGSGSLITEVSGTDDSIRLMCWQLFAIKQDEETILHYFNVYVEPFPDHIDKVMELEHELQRGHIKQAQIALFLLSIEGLQSLLEDTGLTYEMIMELLKRELVLLDHASVVFHKQLEKEKIIIILSSDNVREHVNCWAQSLIEAIHYVVYNCSSSHYVTVTMGVALSPPYCHRAECLLTNARNAMNMLMHRGVDGYYVSSSISNI